MTWPGATSLGPKPFLARFPAVELGHARIEPRDPSVTIGNRDMKPGFALNLSHDGIALLHRAGKGWTLVEDVSLDDPDLDLALETLRRTALGLEPSGLYTKLIIPNSQILYLEVEAPAEDDEARRAAIQIALEGRTPYAAEDLLFDWSGEGEVVKVAVVARETLDEAEGFAEDRQFAPVCFVAMPEGDVFDGEPYFGPTTRASEHLPEDEELERDDEPVRMTTRAVSPQTPVIAAAIAAITDPGLPIPEDEPDLAETLPEVLDDVAEEPEPEEDAPDIELAESAGTDVRDVESPPVEGDQTDLLIEALPPLEGDVVADPPAEVAEQEGPGVPVADLDDTEDDADLNDPAEPGETKAAVTESTLPPEGAEKEPSDPDTVALLAEEAATADDQEETDDTESDATSFAVETPVDTQPEPEKADGFLDRIAPRLGVSALAGVGRAPKISTVKGPASVLAADLDEETDTDTEDDAVSDLPETELPPEPPIGLAKSGAPPAPSVLDKKVRIKPRKSKGALAGFTPETSVFGAKRLEGDTESSQNVGLIAAVIVGLLVGAVGLWAMVFSGEAPVQQADTPVAPVVEVATVTEPSPDVPPTAENVEPPAGDTPPTPELTQDADAMVEPDLAAAPDLPETQTEDLAQPAAPEVQPPDPALASQYAQTGIWPAAPINTAAPGPDATVSLAALPNDAQIGGDSVGGLPDPNAFAPDDSVPLQPSPPPFGEITDFGPDGLIVPTVEGVVTPGGFTLYSGRPDLLPRSRPGDIDERIEAATPPDPLAEFRPRPRPIVEAPQDEAVEGGLETDAAVAEALSEVVSAEPEGPEVDRASLAVPPTDVAAAVAADPALAGKLPRARPQAIVAAVAARRAALEPDPDLAENTSGLAVATSKRPEARPRGFSRAVNAAVAAAVAQPDPTPSAARPAPQDEIDEPEPVAAASNIPTRASVAKQATIPNAIRLRSVNLIGVYGASASRRALVRMGNGRFVKVQVGDRLDGGKVSTITESQLTYVKRGKTIVLKMPKG